MKTLSSQSGGVLVTAVLVGLLLSMLGGVAMNLAFTETVATRQHLEESTSRMLAESGVEQVIAWFTHDALPAPLDKGLGGEALEGTIGNEGPTGLRFQGTPERSDLAFDAGHSNDDLLLNDRTTGVFRALRELGRILRLRLYGPLRPDGFCTVEVTAESKGGVRRTVSVELGALRIPPLRAAVLTGLPPADVSEAGVRSVPTILAHWGEVPEPVPGLPPSPWRYQKFKEIARRFGTYYVPDREGRLYRDGQKDPALAQTPAEVFGSLAAGSHRGLVFVDTMDQAPPAADNLATLVLDSPYMEGIFYVNAHVVLRPQGTGQTIPALPPPPEGQGALALGAPVSIADVRIQGVLHTAGSLQLDHQTRVFGAVVAEGGFIGDGLLEVWYNDDLERGLVRGLPVVYPIKGTWREWVN